MRVGAKAVPGEPPSPVADRAKPLTERSLSFLVRRAHRAFVAVLAEALTPQGISVAEWAVLRALWQEEGLTQVALAARMQVGKASLTPVLRSLERKGILSRTRTDADRRKHALALTRHGRGLEAALLPVGAAINRRARSGLEEDELDIAAKVLERVIGNLQGENGQ